jgi:hypothetical protein
MTALRIEGELHRNADGALQGWCWSPDRPTERMAIDVLINDHVAASVVAARFRQDLADRGVGDGRHAFSIRLPRSAFEVTGGLVISARERASGMVFGRVVDELPSLRADLVPRLAACEQEMAALWDIFAASRTASPSAVARLRPAFTDLAALLRARARGPGAGPEAVAVEALRPAARAVALSLAARPAVSVVLPGTGGAAVALHAMAALAPALHDLQAELVLADDAADDPRLALLPALVAHLCYARADGAAAALNAAAAAARGATLVFLTGTGLSHASLPECVARHAGAPGAVLLGPGATAGWMRRAPPGATAAMLPGDPGLLACLSAGLFAATGGFDAAMDSDPDVMAVDLALKAAMLGAPAVLLQSPWRPGGRAMPAPEASLRARAALRARWGEPALSA